MNSTQTASKTRIRVIAALTAIAATATFAHAATADAKTYSAAGKGSKDSSIGVKFDLDATAKKGKLKKASTLSNFKTTDTPFECSATGDSGKSDYGFWNEPIKIAKNGSFEDVYELEAGGYVVERYTLEGTVSGKGKSAVVSGSFRAEKGAGGIKFNDCDTGTVPFKAKVKL